MDGGHGCVVDFGAFAALAAGSALFEDLFDDGVELAGGDAFTGLFVDVACGVDGVDDVIVFLGADKDEGGEVEAFECFGEVVDEFVGGGFVFGEVPLVDDEYAGFILVDDFLAEFFVDL